MDSAASDIDSGETVWCVVSGVHAVVFVAKSHGRPIAILELRPGYGFHLTSCSGVAIGLFASLADGQAALEEWLGARAEAARRSERRETVPVAFSSV